MKFKIFEYHQIQKLSKNANKVKQETGKEVGSRAELRGALVRA